MSMSTYVEFGKKIDEKFEKYKKILDLCYETNVEVPREVREYFKSQNIDPDPADVIDGIWEEAPLDHEAIDATFPDGMDKIIVDITKLPKDITLIKFVNSY